MNWQHALLEPRTVALIGASADRTKNTSRPLRFLQQCGWQGTIVPINPNHSMVLGLEAYKSVLDYPGGIDHAFVMTAAELLPSVIEQCGAKHIPLVTIYTDGFAELGPSGIAKQAALVDLAKAKGVRLLGPNCIGVIHTHTGFALTVNAVIDTDEPQCGNYALISQSGSMLGSLMTRGQNRGIRFSSLISVGNECDLDLADMVSACASQSQTNAIALFIETIRQPERFREAVAYAIHSNKPVAAYLVGRSELGSKLAQSHTGAMLGSGEALRAFLDDCGVVRVHQFESLIEIAPMLKAYQCTSKLAAKPKKPRVAVLTTTGGAASMVMDNLALQGLDPARPDADLQVLVDASMQAIDDRHPAPNLRDAPVIDLTLAATSKQYAAVLSALARWEGCDAAVAVVGSSARALPALAVHPILEFGATFGQKPFASFFAPQSDEALALLSAHQLAAFRTPESCADAIAALLRRREPVKPPCPILDVSATQVLRTLHEQWEAFGVAPHEPQAYSLLQAMGIPVSEFRVFAVDQLADAMDAEELRQWVLKVVSGQLIHKSDLGGVLTDLEPYQSWLYAVNRLRDNLQKSAPGFHFTEVMAQVKQRALGEAIIGYKHDQVVGPVVVLGAGGLEAELSPHCVVRPAPVSKEIAEEMISEVSSFARYRGYRTLPRGDMRALADAVCALSQLANAPGQPVEEAEINPLLIFSEGSSPGVMAVDALLRFRETAGA